MTVPAGAPPRAKLVGGVWLPDNEDHFADWMRHSKHARRVAGKLTYQYHKLEAALAHLPPGRRRICVDVGAHVGLWSMWLTSAFDRVHAFEPAPPFADIFPWNVAGGNVTLHRTALGDRDDTVEITVPHGQTGGAHVSIAGRHPGNKYAHGATSVYCGLPMRTLDSFGLDSVDFIKIDVEGTERHVIEGASRTIKTCRPLIVIEQKGNEVAYGHVRDEAAALLAAWGMRDLEVLSGDHIMDWP